MRWMLATKKQLMETIEYLTESLEAIRARVGNDISNPALDKTVPYKTWAYLPDDVARVAKDALKRVRSLDRYDGGET